MVIRSKSEVKIKCELNAFRSPEVRTALNSFAESVKGSVKVVSPSAQLFLSNDGGEEWVLTTKNPAASQSAADNGHVSLDHNLQLWINIRVKPYADPDTSQFHCETRGYNYTVTKHQSGQFMPLFAWHWHPNSVRSSTDYPHLHVPIAGSFNKAHAPTGRVLVEDILRFAIRDLRSEPANPDAQELLEESRAEFLRQARW